MINLYARSVHGKLQYACTKNIFNTSPIFIFSAIYFFPLLLAVKRGLDLAVSVLPAPCGVLGAPNAGAGVGDANGLPAMPPGAKLKPPLGAGVAGAAMEGNRGKEWRKIYNKIMKLEKLKIRALDSSTISSYTLASYMTELIFKKGVIPAEK